VGLLGKQTIYVTHFRLVVIFIVVVAVFVVVLFAVNQIHGAFPHCVLYFTFFIVII